MSSFKKNLLKAAVAATFIATSLSSHASLVLVGPAPTGGAGLGTVLTVLTLTSPGDSTTETGAVIRTATGDAITGDAKPGNAQTSTYSFADLGTTQASDLRLIFNANEPGKTAGGENSITLQDLVLTIYNSAGTAVFNSGAFAPQTFGNTFNGIGNAGYEFKLDTAQAAAAQFFALPANRIGLSATANDATGGSETFFVTSRPTEGGGGTGNAVPEPGPVALLGVGLLALLATVRRKVG